MKDGKPPEKSSGKSSGKNGKIYLTNTTHRKKEEFVPADPNHVTMYVCGPTVYDFAHIGNARPAAVFDTLAKLLRHIYPRVTYVRNITDIDDKIIAASQEQKRPISDITRHYEKIYLEDMAALQVDKPDVTPHATDHIAGMQRLIQKLLDQNFAYQEDGHVIFHVPAFSAYGTLSGRQYDEQMAGARVEVAAYKKNPSDFVLWKPSTADEPGWDSPWGRGRPGWHIECSAMAAAHLGESFDIHGGGQDLIFPHHENEIAQSCAAHGTKTMARYWVHNGYVLVDGAKMSKSLGNYVTVHELLDRWPGEVLRLALLSAHYRQPLDFTETLLCQARNTLDRLYRACEHIGEHVGTDEAFDSTSLSPIAPPRTVIEALCDDLNTPAALSALCQLASTILSRNPEDRETRELVGQLRAGGYFLGLLRQEATQWFRQEFRHSSDVTDCRLSNFDIETLIEQRQEARKNKDFTRADQIRDQLAAQGIMIEDSQHGSKWRRL